MRLLLALPLLLAVSTPLVAQVREIHWPRIAVTAHLDADGRLHVSERQEMRFTGDWNGGERRFDLRPGQKLTLERMLRIDPAAGSERQLARGDLDLLDHFGWTDGTTLRWRSRLPSDEPFRDTPITYVFEYTYSNILEPSGDVNFRLDHDFAFRDRSSPIDTFTVALTLDPVWTTTGEFTGRYSTNSLPPGEGYVVGVALTHGSATRPAGVRFGADQTTRSALILLLLLSFAALLALLVVREARLGRFAPLPSESEINPEWLKAHVFSHLPEVVGAAWDDSTAAPEVAATLARLVSEKKLSSEVKTQKIWIFKRNILHLRMEVDRGQFRGHERSLIDALFASNKMTTDTDQVRKRYEKSGFDPAALIRKRLEGLVEATTPGTRGATPSKLPTILLLALGLIAMGAAGIADAADVPFAFAVVGVSVATFAIAFTQAALWRNRAHRLPAHLLRFLLPLGAGLWLLIGVLDSESIRVGARMLAGVTLWVLALMVALFNQARSRHSAERIALRKRLTAARNRFRKELSSERPQLKDEWFPWLIAFGLGSRIDRWFRAFGGAAGGSMPTASAISSSSGSSSGGSSWTGFGGGGGFAGAGSSASFAAAVGGMAASVPAPSSSGSGGGGGGGSSGGGGGGGW